MLIEAKGKKLRLLRKRLIELDAEYFSSFGKDIHPFGRKGNHFYCYIDDVGDFVGYGMLRTFNRFDNPTIGMAIWESYRNKGYERQCFCELIEKSKELGYEKMLVHPHKRLHATIKFYESMGFVICEEKDAHLHMELKL